MKAMSKKIIINIIGPSTAGKSTVAEILRESIERLYAVEFDVVKRQISGYHWRRDGDVAREITLDTLSSVAATGLTILLQLPLSEEAIYERIASIAKENEYLIYNFEITAPSEVLIARYKERLRQIKESGSKRKFKTLEEFKTNLAKPYYRPEGLQSFDSSEMSAEDISGKISNILAL